MKQAIFAIVVLLAGCAPPSCVAKAPSLPPPSEPSGFFVDPRFPDGAAVMTLLRKLFPETKYISMSDVRITGDSSYDYAEFFVGRGIDYGFESVYYRYFIFAKKKTDGWSKARVFDKGELGDDVFEGPMALLESKGWENGKRPNHTAEPPSPNRGGSS